MKPAGSVASQGNAAEPSTKRARKRNKAKGGQAEAKSGSASLAQQIENSVTESTPVVKNTPLPTPPPLASQIMGDVNAAAKESAPETGEKKHRKKRKRNQNRLPEENPAPTPQVKADAEIDFGIDLGNRKDAFNAMDLEAKRAISRADPAWKDLYQLANVRKKRTSDFVDKTVEQLPIIEIENYRKKKQFEPEGKDDSDSESQPPPKKKKRRRKESLAAKDFDGGTSIQDSRSNQDQAEGSPGLDIAPEEAGEIELPPEKLKRLPPKKTKRVSESQEADSRHAVKSSNLEAPAAEPLDELANTNAPPPKEGKRQRKRSRTQRSDKHVGMASDLPSREQLKVYHS